MWGQGALDSHVGYAPADAFSDTVTTPTHRVTARATPLLIAPDVKQPSRAILPMNAKLSIVEAGPRFSRIADDGFVFSDHIAPLAAHAQDWVADRRNISLSTLCLGRQDLRRHRLLGPDPDRARSAPASPRRATPI